MQRTNFTSQKQHLFCLLNRRPNYHVSFFHSDRKETTRKPNIFCSVYVIGTVCFDEFFMFQYFILCYYLKKMLFMKLYCSSATFLAVMLLFSQKKAVHIMYLILFYLFNSSTMLVPKSRIKAAVYYSRHIFLFYFLLHFEFFIL